MIQAASNGPRRDKNNTVWDIAVGDAGQRGETSGLQSFEQESVALGQRVRVCEQRGEQRGERRVAVIDAVISTEGSN